MLGAIISYMSIILLGYTAVGVSGETVLAFLQSSFLDQQHAGSGNKVHEHHSSRQHSVASAVHNASTLVNCCCVAVLPWPAGYFAFPASVSSNVLNSFPPDDAVIQVGGGRMQGLVF
jgi:hypothetical protein